MQLTVEVSCLSILFLLSGCVLPSGPTEPLPVAEIKGVSLPVSAGSFVVDLSTPLTSDALAAIAVYTNPDLKALRATEGIASAQVFSAGLYPDPTFTLGADAPLNGNGFVTALGAGLAYDFAALARRPAARRGAEANLDKIRLDIVWAEWLTGEQARLQFFRISHLRRIKGLSSALRAYADGELDRASEAASRGDFPLVGLEVRRLGAADAADRDRSAELQLKSAELDLARLLGIDPDEVLDLAVAKQSSPPLPDTGELFQQAVLRRADLKGLQAAYESADAAIDAARLGAFPLPSIGLNLARDTSNLRTLGPSVSFTLPIWNRGRGELAVANASQAQLRAEYVARLESVRADIAAARAALEITRAQRADVARSLAPLLTQLGADDRAAEKGDLSASAAASAHMAVLDKQIVEATLALAEAEFGIALEIAAGETLENF